MSKRKLLLLSVFVLLFIFVSIAFSDNSSEVILNFVNIKKRNLELLYEVYWGPFKVGESHIVITPEKYTTHVYTAGLGKLFFPFYATWETWVDENGTPEKVIIFSNERGKKRKKIIKFDKQRGIVIYQKILPKKKAPEIIPVKFPVYDELSAFVAAFFIDYKKFPQAKLPLYIKKEKHYVKLHFKKEVICKVEKKNKKCLKIEAHLPQKSELLKRTSDLEVLLLEKERYPFSLKGKLPIFGSLVGKLKKVVIN